MIGTHGEVEKERLFHITSVVVQQLLQAPAEAEQIQDGVSLLADNIAPDNTVI